MLRSFVFVLAEDLAREAASDVVKKQFETKFD